MLNWKIQVFLVGKSIATPLELNHKLSEDKILLHLMTQKAVSETCEASISYLIITRPDITHAVSVVSQFMQSLRFQLYLMVHRPSRCSNSMLYLKSNDLFLSCWWIEFGSQFPDRSNNPLQASQGIQFSATPIWEFQHSACFIPELSPAGETDIELT